MDSQMITEHSLFLAANTEAHNYNVQLISSNRERQRQTDVSYVKCIIFSLLGGLSLAINNSIASTYVIQYGVRSISTYWLGSIILFATYHVSNYFFTIEKDSGWKVYTYVDSKGTRRAHV
jgi:hypothetical protein